MAASEGGIIESSIASRFEQAVRQYPEHVAIECQRRAYSYDELNRTANRIANKIVDLRGASKEAVAVLFDHNAFAVFGTLAVLKSGKSYAPLSPSFPNARTRYMLENSQSTLILICGERLDLATELASNNHEFLNINNVSNTSDDSNSGIYVSPDASAYIFYSSGSSGQQNGIVQNNRNVLALTL